MNRVDRTGQQQVAVVGAGMAGLACAGRLAAAGLCPVVFEKSRGPGGRMATRRIDPDLQFDHGAQFLTARDPRFRSLLKHLRRTHSAAVWTDGAAEPHWVGTPRMSSLARALARDLDVRTRQTVTAVESTPAGIRVHFENRVRNFDQAVLTAPAPQVARILGSAHPLTTELAGVRFEPCWALMVALVQGPSMSLAGRRPEEGPFSWIARDSSKPDRQGGQCWVAHAAPDWSQTHLEETSEVVVAELLPEFCAELGIDVDQVAYADAHRWRYARVTRPLGRPFLRDEDGLIYAAGDWCLGPRIEAAWQSGIQLADDLLFRQQPS